MKRHSRPYGCTFPHCWKRFGSRNDWKRHENSQHFLQEMWRCQIAANGGYCGRLFYNVDAFQKHLGRKHPTVLEQELRRTGMRLEELAARKAKEMHLGREGYHHFWCGFCNELKPQMDGTHNAWEERFKHIGDHYDKRDANIDLWVCIEQNKQKQYITKADRKKAKQRSRMGAVAEEDSDLGESGIPGPSSSLPFVVLNRYTVPVSFPLPGFDPAVSAQRSTYMSGNKRQRMSDADPDADADGVSDNEFGRGM